MLESLDEVIVEAGRFPWDSGRFPEFVEPVASYNGLRWWDNFGEYGFLTRIRSEQLRDVGATMTPRCLSSCQIVTGMAICLVQSF